MDQDLNSNEIHISKRISYLLRHGAIKVNLPIRPDGFVNVDELFKWMKGKVDRQAFERVIHGFHKGKRRFSTTILEDGQLYTRANYGHSIDVPELALTRIQTMDDIEKIFSQLDNSSTSRIGHGTRLKSWQEIKVNGLSIMKRNWVHLAIIKEGQDLATSNIRPNSDLIIYLNVKMMLEDGIDIFITATNHCILSSGINGIIPTKYFSQVVNLHTGEIWTV